MGKNLKGKECGKGICQRKDGLYSARFVDTLGKRHDKYFPTLQEARNWLKQAKEAPTPQDELFNPTEMTVDTWFEFWINNIVGDLAPNTKRNYRERYQHNIQPVIGSMRLIDVKPMYCKMVLNQMDAAYAPRATESGMQPKVPKKLLGHASIKTTMDRYVHVTDESMNKAVQQFETLFA